METKKERKKKREERKKTRRFRKELKMFLRDILLIEPLRLCPTPTLLPFHPSSIRSLSLFPVHSLSDISLDLILPGAAPYSPPPRVSLYTSVFFTLGYSIFIHFYPFTYLLCFDSNLPGSVVYCSHEKRRKIARRARRKKGFR